MGNLKRIEHIELGGPDETTDKQNGIWIHYTTVPENAAILDVAQVMNRVFLVIEYEDDGDTIAVVSWPYIVVGKDRFVPVGMDYVGSAYLYDNTEARHVFHDPKRIVQLEEV